MYVHIWKANNNRIYDLTNHLMVDLETIIALATMTYIGESNVYELHPGDEKSSTTLLMKARIFCYTYYRG